MSKQPNFKRALDLLVTTTTILYEDSGSKWMKERAEEHIADLSDRLESIGYIILIAGSIVTSYYAFKGINDAEKNFNSNNYQIEQTR